MSNEFKRTKDTECEAANHARAPGRNDRRDCRAPVLQKIVISSNNLSRARHADGTQIVATHQLNTLPTTLTDLTMNGVFSDSTDIDLLDYQLLSVLNFHTYYSRNAQRRMTGGTVSPKVYTNVSAGRGIKSYMMYNQPYYFVLSVVQYRSEIQLILY